MTIDEITDTPAPTPAPHRSRRSRSAAVGSAAALASGAASALLVALTAAPGGATGTTFTVDSLGDGAATGSHCTDGTPANCTVRDALAVAAEGDTIVFDGSLSGSILLTEGELDITRGVTIDGPGAAYIRIDAQSDSRVFSITGITSSVVIDGLTVTGGRTYPYTGLERERSGGGIYIFDSSGSVTLSNLDITDNVAVSGLGGGVYLLGSTDLTIVDCLISGNTTSPGRGGGLSLNATSVNGEILIRNTTIVGNSSFSAGGMYMASPGPVLIANSTIIGNSATNGQGGGLLAYRTAGLRIDQSTVTQNAATLNGGGVALQLSTTLSGTIIWGNTSGTVGREDLDNYGTDSVTVTSEGSLFGSVSTRVTLTGSGNLLGVDPMFDTLGLAMNGGATPTIALRAGSPAIDSGPTTVATFPGNAYDQRGLGFDRVVGGMVDIGAYEYSGTDPMPSPGDDIVVPAFTG